MNSKKLIVTVLGILPILLFLSGCIHVKYAYLPKPSEFKTYTKGMIAEMSLSGDLSDLMYKEGSRYSPAIFRGEMIAVTEDTLWVLPLHSEGKEKGPSGLIPIPRDLIESMNVLIATTSENHHSSDALTVANSMLALSHGWWAILTLPINLGVNLSFEGSARARPYKMELGSDDVQWEHLFKFCRFPQGMPEGIARSKLE